MRKLRVITGILAMSFLGLAMMSCKEGKKENDQEGTPSTVQSEEGSNHEDHAGDEVVMNGQETSDKAIINAYLNLKDALVRSDKDAAGKAGSQLVESTGDLEIDSFSEEEQKELNEILESAKEHGEHIAKSDMDHQREHFEMLSTDINDLVAIIGTDETLYQQYCPMYNNNKGGMWLSASEEIRNPYFGDKMLKCGSVQKEIN